MLASTAIALPWPSNGPRPSTAAYRVAPSDHRSEAGLAGCPRIRSGAQNPGVPMTMPAWVSPGSPCKVAMPKSVSTALPSGVIRMLPGLTSRCTTPAACAVPSASSSVMPIIAARAGGSGPSSARTWASDLDGTSSMMIHGVPPASITSCTVTTPGWLSRAATRASRIERSRSTFRSW